jgi:Tol biopolymer transport system component
VNWQALLSVLEGNAKDRAASILLRISSRRGMAISCRERGCSPSKGAVPRRLDLGIAAAQPTISRLGNRLAFEVLQYDLNIWRTDLKGPGKEPSQPIRFISSTQIEQYPAYSPDGRWISFMSQRSGTDEIWICESDGSGTRQLTSFGGAAIYGPSGLRTARKSLLRLHRKE